jgi:hypothetical protein
MKLTHWTVASKHCSAGNSQNTGRVEVQPQARVAQNLFSSIWGYSYGFYNLIKYGANTFGGGIRNHKRSRESMMEQLLQNNHNHCIPLYFPIISLISLISVSILDFFSTISTGCILLVLLFRIFHTVILSVSMHPFNLRSAAALAIVYNAYSASAIPTAVKESSKAEITPVATLNHRQDDGSGVSVIGTSSVAVSDIVCPMSSTDPATFGNSGATSFLDDFLVNNGPNDWLFNMDQKTTAGGNQPSSLHCQPLGGETCPAPTVQCQFFTPPEQFFLRIAATNAHDFFTAAHETLQNVVITDALSIDQIVADFAPQKPDDNNDILADIFKLVAPGFSMSDKVVKQGKGLGPSADGLGFIGGLISLTAGAIALADATAPPDVSVATLTTNVENLLGTIFTNTQANIESMNSKIFGGSPSPDVDLDQIISFVSAATGDTPESSLQQITKIFASGSFMAPVDQSALSAGITAGFQLIKQQLVASLLAAQQYFVFVDTNRSEDDCNGITGSRFINNQCFTIEKRTQNSITCAADQTPIDASIVLKFDDPNAGYNIDLPTFYQNVQQCNNGQAATGLDIDNDLPRCAFNIGFVTASKSVCNAVGTPNLPSNLDINSDACNKVVCPNPGFFGKCNTHC